MAAIRFEAELEEIEGWTLVRLPKDASAQLPSRGLVMVEGGLNGHAIRIALEPDGKGSHWLALPDDLQKNIKAGAGDTVAVELNSIDEWVEPELPDDIRTAFEAEPDVMAAWADITPLARWDWLRWMRATKVAATREKRINTAIDMLSHGKRRPCCFDRSQCTVPEVSKSGKLLSPLG